MTLLSGTSCAVQVSRYALLCVRRKQKLCLKHYGPSHKIQGPGTCALLHMSIAITSSTEEAPAGVNNRQQICHYTQAL